MGRYCWMCGLLRPNEQFSGGGYTRCLCKRCARQPRAERERVRALIDLGNYLEQKNISEGNIARLRSLCSFQDQEVRSLASLILEIALVHPRRKKRLGYLRYHRPELYDRLVERVTACAGPRIRRPTLGTSSGLRTILLMARSGKSQQELPRKTCP